MQQKPTLSTQLALAIMPLMLAVLACSFSFNLPGRTFVTGPTQSETIRVPAPDGPADVRLRFGAGVLRLSPGTGDALIEGSATYNVEKLKPVVETTGNQVSLTTGDLDLNGLPGFGSDFENEWDLSLGTMPMRLQINAGAYQGNYELGGLSLEHLEVGDGAADVRLRFSEPNLVEMDQLRYETGASSVALYGLANANFENMSFRSGAGSYTLDFSGALQRDASVRIESGISQVTLIVPEGMAAEVTFDGGMTNVETSGSWRSGNGGYENPGQGPRLQIQVELGAGSLQLRND